MEPVTLDAVLTDSNLFDAWAKVRGNKGCAGIDGQTLEDFAEDLMANLDLLRMEVRSGSYRPLPLLRVYIDKKSGGKRPLSIPAVRDRVLQTAVALVLTPLFEAEFEDVSFAYRKGRSVDQAVQRVIRLRDEGYRWVVDADIDDFFDEIDHELLMAEVAALVGDEEILRLIRQWLTARVVDGKRRWRLKKGVPQGSPISPLLSNLYLDHLDEALLGENLKLIRFADDFIILCKKRRRAEEALELTEEVLEALKLSINEDKTRLVNFRRGFRFLGVQFIRSLAFKSKYPVPGPVLESLPRTGEQGSRVMSSAQALEMAAREPQNAMQLAFAEAGLDEDDFPDAPVHPVESGAAPQPSDDGAPASHDSRLRTLYLMEHGYVLGKESERLVVRREDTVVKEIPAIKVDQIMVFGNAQITTQAMQFCLQEKIPIFLLSGRGRYYGVVDSFDTDPVLLHRDQFARAADKLFCLNLAREFVRGKITNSRTILRRQQRKRDAPALGEAAGQLKQILPRLDSAETLDQLRGFEGNAARIYFGAFAGTFGAKWNFKGRNRQPPTDPVNAMLSYGYTLLYYNIYSFLRARGLNPHVGYLHPLRAGHPALASDLIEEFRAIVVDAVVLKLVLNGRVSPEQFDLPQQPGEPCLLNKEARDIFVKSLEAKLNSPIRHPASGLRLDYRRCIEHQIRQLAAVIRGREERYRPMVVR